MDKPFKREKYLHLVDLLTIIWIESYLKMSPFEALYDRRCVTPLSWDNPVNRFVLAPDMLKDMEQEVFRIKTNWKAGQDRQKSDKDQQGVHT